MELYNIIGEFRDFNGGMISKQNELLSEIKDLLANTEYNELLLDNFFYSLIPVIMRTVLEPQAVHTSFLMLQDAIEQGFTNNQSHLLKIFIQAQFVFAIVKAEKISIKEDLQRSIGKLQLHSSELATSLVSVYDTTYVAYTDRCDEKEKHKLSATHFNTLPNNGN
ncbi:MAG: hypothetical protein QM711_04955 [Micropruina sp.]|uniref:hypothetical protein n=1 Tax=Micropruina sp. TaxID=2737536 RepID=UPI0039E593D7